MSEEDTRKFNNPNKKFDAVITKKECMAEEIINSNFVNSIKSSSVSIHLYHANIH